MSLRQKEKSEMTHQEIKAAALRLFLENGYKNTSVQDIVTESGYSIGSFYNHYKTKRDVLADIWNEHAIAFISHSIDEMKAIRTPEELADYLIDNSNAFDRDEKTISLAKAAQEDLVTVGKNYEGVRDISQLYLKEIASVLRIFCPHTEEVILPSLYISERAISAPFKRPETCTLIPSAPILMVEAIAILIARR